MNKTASKIARRYARALFELAQERGELDRIAKTVGAISNLISVSEEFQEFLADPRISSQEQCAVMDKLFASKADAVTYNFLRFLVEKNKVSVLPKICMDFEKMYLTQKGILKVKLISYQEMEDGQIREICSKLQQYFHKEVQPEQELDPDLLGGFKVQVGDKIYDFSIRTQLERFRQAVMAA